MQRGEIQSHEHTLLLLPRLQCSLSVDDKFLGCVRGLYDDVCDLNCLIGDAQRFPG